MSRRIFDPAMAALRRAAVGSLVVMVAAATTAAGAPADTERRATIAVSGEPLAEALPCLGRAAGLGIRCGPNSSDRRVYLFAEDRRLTEIMGRLKRFIPHPPGEGLWFRYGSGSVFDEDLASLNARRAAAARRRQERLAAGRKAMQEVREWAAISEYPTTDVGLREHVRKYKAPACERWDVGRAHDVLGTLPPSLLERALLGQVVRIPVSSLSAAGRKACWDAESGHPPIPGRADSPEVQAIHARRLTNTTLILRPHPGAGARQVSLSMIFQEGSRSGGSGFPEIMQVPKESHLGGE